MRNGISYFLFLIFVARCCDGNNLRASYFRKCDNSNLHVYYYKPMGIWKVVSKEKTIQNWGFNLCKFFVGYGVKWVKIGST